MIFSQVKKHQKLGYNGLTTKQGRPSKMKDNSKQTKVVKNSDKLDDKDKN